MLLGVHGWVLPLVEGRKTQESEATPKTTKGQGGAPSVVVVRTVAMVVAGAQQTLRTNSTSFRLTNIRQAYSTHAPAIR